MPIPISISEMSVTPSLNSPQGTESAKGTIDDYLRAHAAFIRQTSDLVLGATVTLPSASMVAIGFAASSNIAITGTTTINSFDTYAEGALRYVTFSGAMTLVYSAAMALPTTANITTISGDSALFKSLGGGNWKCLMYQRLSGYITAAALSPYMPLAGGTFTGRAVADGNVTGNSTIATATASLGEIEVQGNGTGAAMMCFHRPGVHAIYFGLDTDNVWKVGGGTAGAVAYTLFHSGNLTNLSQLTNGPGYITGITSGNVTTALGFTPYNSTNPAGYITSISSGNVTAALGFTPYNSTNPNGYISNVTTALGFTPANAAGQAFTGNISAPVVTQTSNERKKKNWQRLPVDFIEKFASIKKAGLFQWRKGGAHCVGVGAQSLEVIMPAAVHTDEKGDKSVNTGGAALAIAHELSREVVRLRARLDKLEG